MQQIALPKKIEFIKGEKPEQKQVIIEPCYPGYGATLGNALRRVMLSSLPGAAVVGVKIKGASHEFMTLPHIKEDVLEIVLALKKLRLKIHSNEEETFKLELSVHGEKEVKASDITKNSQVEIINPELTLAHITDMAGNLSMEIFVANGRGYETNESRENKKNELGYIEIDSIYSPVLSVGVKIDYIRVGKMTNWDKLILDIITDGTITPEYAFNETYEILIKQFTALKNILNEETEADEETATVNEVIEITTEENVNQENEVSDEAEKKKRGRPKKA
jgi:DNA-directed RNA polymerase subunit alpha